MSRDFAIILCYFSSFLLTERHTSNKAAIPDDIGYDVPAVVDIDGHNVLSDLHHVCIGQTYVVI